MAITTGSKLGPYEILAPIGAGGMGEVWKARDTRLGRTVAIKILNKEHMQRFEREARAIAALNHPHICTLHDIGPDYLVMEYVEGFPIKGPLPVEKAVRLAIQIAGALDEAHRNNILHRDLKPGNILVTRERLDKIARFRAGQAGSGGGLRDGKHDRRHGDGDACLHVSRAGARQACRCAFGHFQFRGGAVRDRLRQPALRGNFYGPGVERRAARRAEAAADVAAVGAHRDAVPGEAAFNTISNYVGGQDSTGESSRRNAKPAEQQPSIAVLPFVNMSGDKEQEYFSDGLAEEIINALAQIPGLMVIARTSSFAFRGKEQDIRQDCRSTPRDQQSWKEACANRETVYESQHS